ncbi:MAG: acetylglutamate kinase [Gemmatimonadales bacterium]|nr:MAG: acetylglutamate kinase [Gemmatimonadales bacterium]
MLTVIKAGGAWLDEGARESEIRAIVGRVGDVVIIHGGGHEISRWEARCGIETERADGLRVTRGDSVALTSMVLSGLVNKGLVRSFQEAGCRAVGISGEDADLFQALPLDEARYGAVGEVDRVNPQVVRALLSAGMMPIISPVSSGPGGPLNVNADAAAVALARGMGADRLLLVSDVPGVLVEGAILPFVDPAQALELEGLGHISGGMTLKVKQAMAAARDVPEVFIGGSELLHELGRGTRVLGKAPTRVRGAA